jgi:hypothetical protein
MDFCIYTRISINKQGENELTAKISCHDNGVSAGTTPPGSPLSEWHTVNVTGVAGAATNPLPSLSGTEKIDEPNEESANEEEEYEEESVSDTDGSDSDSGDDDSNDGLWRRQLL